MKHCALMHALLVPMQGNEVITQNGSNGVQESLEPKVLLHIVDGDSGLTVLLQHGKA